MRTLNLLLISMIGFSGCASIQPYLQDFNIVSLSQEQALGLKFAEQIATELPVKSSGPSAAEVQQIGTRLLNTLSPQPFEYEFSIVEDKTPNAFTIPAGKIYVHSGLLQFAGSEAELAGVIAHEIGHAVERHPTKSLSRTHGVETLSKIIFKNQAEANSLQKLTLNLAKTGFITKYGRDDEREADDIAIHMLSRAGYDPQGLVRFLKKLNQLQPGGSRGSFLSTHPPTPERIARLESQLSGSNVNAQLPRG